MNALSRNASRSALVAIALAGILAGCASMLSSSNANVALSGANEVPPVTTDASGNATFTVDRDWTIQGKVTTQGLAGTAAHIHDAPPGKNGGVIIPLAKTGDNEWSVPPGTRLSEAQFNSYRAGSLYVNVHSAANPGGEIRGQLTP
jgi:hypothetical protein